MAQFHGSTGKVYTAGVEIAVRKLEWTKKNEIFDATTTKSRGTRVRAAGMYDSEGTLTLVLDTLELIESAKSLSVGSVFALKQEFSSTVFNAGYVIVESIGYPLDIGGEVEVTISFQGCSAITGAI